MTVQESAAQLAEGLAIVLAATQRNADLMKEAPRGTLVWMYADHLRQWHAMVDRLSVASEMGDHAAEFVDLIEEAERILFDEREPWIFTRKRNRFRRSAVWSLERHGTVMHAAWEKASTLAAGASS